MNKKEFVAHINRVIPEDALIFHYSDDKESAKPVPFVFDGTEKLIYLESVETYYMDKLTGKLEPEELAKKYNAGNEPDPNHYTKIVVI